MTARIVEAKIGLRYRYSARVFESIGGLVWRYPGWRFQIYWHWAGTVEKYGGQSRLYPSRATAEAAANKKLDRFGADIEGAPVSEKEHGR